jgi:predicted ATP-dependent serine protease
MMTENRFPQGWDEERVRRVLAHYESQRDEEVVAEDKQAFENGGTVVEVPTALLPVIREVIAQYEAKTKVAA